MRGRIGWYSGRGSEGTRRIAVTKGSCEDQFGHRWVGDSQARKELQRRPGLRALDEAQLRRSFLTRARAMVMGCVTKILIWPNALWGSWNTPSCLRTDARS